MKKLFLILCVTPLLFGCTVDEAQISPADDIVEKMHQAIQQEHWDDAMDLYDDSFFKTHNHTEWKQQLATLTQGLGKLKKIKPTFQQNNPRLGGKYFLYGFQLKYDNGTIKETISVFKSDKKHNLYVTEHFFKTRRNKP